MKRSGFQPPDPIGPDGRRRYSTLPPSEGPKPKHWGTRAAPNADGWRLEYLPEWMTAEPGPKYTPFELAWFAYVRRFPCFGLEHEGCDGDMVAAHFALNANQKGMGMKVPHDQTGPACQRHHDFWDGRLGQKDNPWAGWSKDDRYELAAKIVKMVRDAAIPEDREHAIDLQTMGLGEVEDLPGGTWKWCPGRIGEP